MQKQISSLNIPELWPEEPPRGFPSLFGPLNYVRGPVRSE
jgi:hypothetical protein